MGSRYGDVSCHVKHAAEFEEDLSFVFIVKLQKNHCECHEINVLTGVQKPKNEKIGLQYFQCGFTLMFRLLLWLHES